MACLAHRNLLDHFRCWIGVVVILVFLTGWPSLAASISEVENFHHTKWTSENGLGSVFDIQQSAEGFLWLTTSRGVLRFDGVRFQTVGEATFGAVDTNEIDSVFVPSSGGLWLSTMSTGLVFWKDGHLTAFADRRCTPLRKAGRMVEDHDGSLWIQASAGISHLRDSVCEEAGAEQGYPGGVAAGILMDRSGTLWVKTRSGQLLRKPRGQSKFQVSRNGAGVPIDTAFLHEAPDGAIWLSDEQGIRCVSRPGSPALITLPGKPSRGNSRFSDFTFAADGSLWTMTPKGVQRFERVDRWTTSHAMETAPGEVCAPRNRLSSDAVWKLLIDREGVAWVGTNSGLDQLRRNVLSKPALKPAQEREFGVAAGDGGSVWIGNAGLPLTRIAADGAVTSFPITRQTICIRRDRNGTIWSAGVGDFHLWRSSAAGFSPVHYPGEKVDAVVSLAVDRRDDPWITTRAGKVFRFVNGTWSNQNQELGKRPGVVGAMAADQDGNVWFAFSEKVVQWDGSDYHVYVRRTRGVSESTMSIRGGHVWLGGPGGVQLFTQGRFVTMRWQDPTLPGGVSGVLETGTGDLWINGFSGIVRVTASVLKAWLNDPASAVTAERFNGLDGLPGLSGERFPEPSLVQASDGRLWFATTKGIAWLDPAALERNRNRLPPPVVVSAIVANGKVYPGRSSLTLPKHTENLEIDYTALSLAIPERVLFRYKLDGVDDGWQNAGTRRQAFYTKLRPGPYTFRVTACNNDGVWNEAGALLSFTVSPAWFQTGWFGLLSGACAVLMVWLFCRLRVRHLANRIHERFAERLAERNRIAQDLHDTLLQGFMSASMQVHVARERLPEDSPVRPVLTRSLELMRQVIDEGRNALRALRSTGTISPDLESALAHIPQELSIGFPSERPAEFRLIVEGQQRSLNPLLRDEVYQIGREGLTNAFRHARASHVEIELRYGSGDFRLLVRDDGCGVDPDTLKTGVEGHWGLAGMRERADRVGARLRVFAGPSGGTEVYLWVPGCIAYQDGPARRLPWFRNRSRSMPACEAIQNLKTG